MPRYGGQQWTDHPMYSGAYCGPKMGLKMDVPQVPREYGAEAWEGVPRNFFCKLNAEKVKFGAYFCPNFAHFLLHTS